MTALRRLRGQGRRVGLQRALARLGAALREPPCCSGSSARRRRRGAHAARRRRRREHRRLPRLHRRPVARRPRRRGERACPTSAREGRPRRAIALALGRAAGDETRRAPRSCSSRCSRACARRSTPLGVALRRRAHDDRGAELAVGFAVTGDARAGRAAARGRAGSRAGDRLILTKPLGTGVLSRPTCGAARAAPALEAALASCCAATPRRARIARARRRERLHRRLRLRARRPPRRDAARERRRARARGSMRCPRSRRALELLARGRAQHRSTRRTRRRAARSAIAPAPPRDPATHAALRPADLGRAAVRRGGGARAERSDRAVACGGRRAGGLHRGSAARRRRRRASSRLRRVSGSPRLIVRPPCWSRIPLGVPLHARQRAGVQRDERAGEDAGTRLASQELVFARSVRGDRDLGRDAAACWRTHARDASLAAAGARHLGLRRARRAASTR